MLRWTPILLVAATAFGQAPSDWDKRFGKSLAAHVEEQWSLFPDASVTEYVRKLGGKLEPNVPVEIRVIDRSDPRAISLPGGYVYVTWKLLLRPRTLAELAAVLAHEIAHTALMSLTVRTDRTLPLFLGDGGGLCDRFSDTSLMPIGYLPKQRALEQEADLLAIQYLSGARYDPRGFVDFFDRMKLDGGLSPEVRAKATKLSEARQDYIVNSSQFIEVQARINALNPPRRPPTLYQ